MDSVIQHLRSAREDLKRIIAEQEQKCVDSAHAGARPEEVFNLIPAPHRLLSRIIDTAIERATQITPK
jgi:hypothetical protein